VSGSNLERQSNKRFCAVMLSQDNKDTCTQKERRGYSQTTSTNPALRKGREGYSDTCFQSPARRSPLAVLSAGHCCGTFCVRAATSCWARKLDQFRASRLCQFSVFIVFQPRRESAFLYFHGCRPWRKLQGFDRRGRRRSRRRLRLCNATKIVTMASHR
jgi:hypothetical protein